MRTTLDIADDVLLAAKEHARREHKTLGQMVSELARRALTLAPDTKGGREPQPVFGLKPFSRRGAIVTNDLVDRLRDDDAY